MIYFKKIALPPTEMQILEKAMRRVSLKRARSLDFTSAVTDIGSDRLFLGFEGTESVQFLRLRTSLEKFLPEIIISIPCKEIEGEYKFRYSLLSTVIFILLGLYLLLCLSKILLSNSLHDFLLIPLALFGGYFLLMLLELKIVTSRINKAVNLYNANDMSLQTRM